MEKFTQINHIPGTHVNRFIFSYLFVILCFIGMSGYGQAGQEIAVKITEQPSLVPVIAGPDTVCSGTGEYQYTTEPGMVNYEWSISPGGTILSGSGTNTVVASWLQGGTGLLSVNYAGASTPGTLDVSVFPVVVPAIFVIPENNPVCDGLPVTYSATFINGGTSPGFQWMVNGVPVGNNSAVFTYTPSNGDAVTCTLITNAQCSSLPQVVSSPVTMIVNSMQQAGVFIYASSNPVCQGTPVNFNAVPQNGGGSPVYQWTVNGVNAGSNSPVFSMTPTNGDLVVCVMTSSTSCVSTNPVVSNPVVMTVGQSHPVSVTIAPSLNPVCQDIPVVFTAIPVNGGNSPQYLWKVNNLQAGAGTGSFSYVPVDGDAVTCALTSNVSCAQGNPAISEPVTMDVVQVLPVTVSIQASANPVCQGTAVTFTANPINGGPSPVFQWMLNGFPVGINSDSFTYIPATGDVVLCKIYSSVSCPSVVPAVSNSVVMTVNPNTPVSVSISASANPVCVSSPVTITTSIFNGGSDPVFEWRVNGTVVGTNSTSYTFTPINGDQVVCYMTSNADCAPVGPIMSNILAMTVSPQLPASVSILASMNPVCQNIQVVYTANPSNGGTSPVFQWKVNGVNSGANNAVFTHTPVDNDQISCTMLSNLACVSANPANSNVIVMDVIPSAGVPVGITITPSSNPSCVGQTVTFTASTVNGGSSPVYAWAVNGLDVGTNSPSYSYVPSTGDFVRCWVTSDLTCATNNPAGSNEILMTVNQFVPVSVSITSSANPACAGSVVTFTANAVNPGASPVYQWKVDGVNAGTNQNTFAFSPALGNKVSCKVTSSLGCTTGNPASSNLITMNILPVLPVGITISTLTNPSCSNTQVTYKATVSNGGTTPAYLWKLNGNSTGSNNSVLILIPASGDVVTCRLTSNAQCYTGTNVVTSAPITMVVSQELTPSVTIAASANPFCDGSPVTFTAAPTNGGAVPVYHWSVNCQPVGSTSATYTYTPADGDYVICQMTSSLVCAVMNPCKSNGIAMHHNTETPAGITVSASANPICTGSAATFAATVMNGGTSPVYLWKVNGNNAGSNSPGFTYNPANGDVVTCKLTSNASCVSGNPVTSTPLAMMVSTALPASVTISTLTNLFCPGTAVNFSAVSTNGGQVPFYQWKVNGVGTGTNAPAFSFFPANGDVVQCDMTSSASCISGTNPVSSNQVTLQSGSPVPVSISIATATNPVCQGNPVTVAATYAGGGDSPVFQWNVNGNPAGTNSPTLTFMPGNGDVVNCTIMSSLSCASAAAVVSNTVIMTVDPSMPVSAIITASLNPCCLGSPVTFSAAVQNGGSSPVYQWIVNCINVGTNSPQYTYTPVNGDVVVCQVVSNASCATGNPLISNNINMVVLPIQPVSVEILASFNPFCAGNPILFTATPTNGGLAPVYQWQVNHVNVGTNNYTYTYHPVDGDSVQCFLTSNASCTTGNPAISDPVKMVANSALNVTIAISSSLNSICPNTNVTFNATTTNAGNSPLYQWKVNGITKGTNPTYSYSPAIGDVVTCQLISSLSCATPNPAISEPLNMIVFPPAPLSVTATASQNPTCLGTPVTFNAAVQNGGTNPIYYWRVNGTVVGSNSPTYTYTPLNGDAVYCRVTSNAQCVTGNPASSNQIVMSASPNAPASITIAPSINPVCSGSTVVFTATPFNGGTAPVYQWKVNGVNSGTNSTVFAYIPVNGDIVRCEMISNSMCTAVLNATSNAITMTVSPIQPVSISVVPSVNPVCINSYVTFTANGVNGGAAPQYQWKVNGLQVGTNTQTYTYIPGNGDVVTCRLTSALSCTTGNPATSSPVTMAVSASLPVGIGLSSSANPSCQGQPVVYTATPQNGGLDPVYQWMVNGINVGSSAPVYTYVPAQGDHVICQLTSDFSCATGNPAVSAPYVADVNPNLPTAVSIVSSGNPVCSGSPVIYTATPVNGGNSPVYQWKVNGVNSGTNSTSFSYLPMHGDYVTCELTSDIACPANNPVMSNTIVMNVVPPVTAAVSVAPSQNPTCQGSPVTFVATPVNGGFNPVYQWKLNGSNVGSGHAVYSMTPADGDAIICEMTSNAACISTPGVQSAPVTMTVSTELPVAIAIQASTNPVCLGQPVTYSSSVVNGGMSPAYLWVVNGINIGNSSPELIFTPSNGDIIECLVTSDLSCATGNPATSNAITMSVTSAIPSAISIASSANPVCLGTPVTLTASYSNAGTSPAFQWKVNGNNAGGNQATFTYIPSNSDIVTCQLFSDNPCSYSTPVVSNQVVMVVSTDLPVNISISESANQVCSGIPVTFTAVPENGGATPAYQWTVNGTPVGTSGPVYTYTPSDGDLVMCILTSALSCASGNPASSNVVAMTVYVPQAVSVNIAANPSGPVCAGNSVEMIATPANGGTNPSYQWFKNGIQVGTNQPTFNFIPADGDQVFVELHASQTCSSGSVVLSPVTTLNVTTLVEPGVSVTVDQNSVCEGTPVTFTAIPVNGGIPGYQWFVNGSAAGLNQPVFSYTPVNGDHVYVTMTSGISCVTAPTASSGAIIMTVNPALPVAVTIIGDQNPVCQGATVNFSAIPVNGGVPSYQWFLNGSPTGLNQPGFSYIPVHGDQVYVVLTSGLTCVTSPTASSNIITMTVNQPLPVGVSISVSQNPVCQGLPVTFSATPVYGGNPAYQWYKNNILVGSNQPTYSFIPVEGDEVYVEMSSSLACISSPTIASGPVIMSVNNLVPVSVTIVESLNNVCEGTMVTYSATAINGGTGVYQWYKNDLPVGSNTDQYSCIPVNGDRVYVQMSSDVTCAIPVNALSNVVEMVVNPAVPVSVSIAADASTVCLGTPVTLLASPVNGGSPAYQWFKNGVMVGSNQPSYMCVPANGDVIYVHMTSSLSCVMNASAMSNTIIIQVDQPLPVSVSISANQNPVCQGTSVTFTAMPVNGGVPVYQWYRNNIPVGSNTAAYSCVPDDGDQVHVEMVSSLSCVTSSTVPSISITMNVTGLVPVSVAISPDQNNVCEGTTVTFTATGVNGGAAIYQWHKNGLSVGSNASQYSCIPLNGDQIDVVMTSDLACATPVSATSNVVSMVVNAPLATSVTIVPDNNNICAGMSVTFTATPVNGGTPTYQWYKNGVQVGSGQPAYSCVPVDGDLVYVEMTSALACVTNALATSNTVTMSVNQPLAVSVGITVSQNPVCQGTEVIFTASPVNGGNPAYQWFKNSQPVGFNQNTYSCLPGNGDQVYVEMTTSLSCVSAPTATSTVETMTVNDLLPVSVTVTESQNSVCEGTTVIFSATGINGGNPVFQWYKNGLQVGSNASQYSCAPVNGDQVYATMTSDLSCSTPPTAMSNVVNMLVNSALVVEVSITSDTNNVCAGTEVAFTATPVNGGNATYQWFKNGVPAGTGLPVFSCTPVDGDVIHAVMTSGLPCVVNSTASSNMITMVVNQPLPISVNILANQNPVCQGTVVTFNATPQNGGVAGYEWYKNGVLVGSNLPAYAFVPENGDEVHVKMISGLTCVETPFALSDTVVMAVNAPLSVAVSILPDQNEVCQGMPVTLTATPVNGGLPVYQWYKNDTLAGENSIAYSFIPDAGDRVYVKMTSSLSCVDATQVISNTVFPVVNSLPAQALLITGPSLVCAGTAGAVYSIVPVKDATSYTWNVPAGVTISAGLHEPVVTLDFNGDVNGGTISVYGSNGCGNGASSPGMLIQVAPVPDAPEISLEDNSLVSTSVSGNQWYFEGTAIQDSTGQTLAPDQSGWYWSVVTENGCSSDTSNHVYYDGFFPGPITSEPGFWVYPIPNDGHFTVAICLPAPDTFDITVYNSMGIQLFELPGIDVKDKFKRVIDLRPKLPKGLFTVVFTCDDYRVVKKMLIYNR